MRTVESKVYQFDELSESAKERAREWWRETSSDFCDFDGQSVIDDAARLALIFGLDLHTKRVKLMNGSTRLDPEVYYSGFCSQSDGACYSGSYNYRKGGTLALAKEAPCGEGKGYEGNNEINRIARELQDVQRRNFYQITASITGRDHHGFSVSIDVERADDKPLSEGAEDTVTECLRDFADYIYRQLEREYEYRNADEQVDDSIRANEYEFTEDGTRA